MNGDLRVIMTIMFDCYIGLVLRYLNDLSFFECFFTLCLGEQRQHRPSRDAVSVNTLLRVGRVF